MAGLDALVVGSGGREYELARQMALSAKVRKVYVAPGNDGTAALDKGENVAIGPIDAHAIAAFAQEKQIGLTIIGPDAAVAAGVGNALREAGCAVFGPTREAGKLEASKGFAAEFLHRHNITHPKATVARTLDQALAAIQGLPPESYVLKADGLAAGKGVVLPESVDEAQEVLREMFAGEIFDGAGKSGVVIQERLHGPEVSAFVITDGTDMVLLPLVQDHKRLRDGDEGLNTGGMGSYAPVPDSIAGKKQIANIRAIAEQTIAAMAKEGTPYQGMLYIGLMLAEERGGDPVVIEYNARFGDPEAEILLPLLHESGVDVVDMLQQAAAGNLTGVAVPKSFDVSVLTVALASAGYPQSSHKGDVIYGLDKQYEGVIIQHAGTAHRDDGAWVTAGGRVLYVTATGKDVNQAASRAYAAIGEQGIYFNGMQYRTDIGWQARK
jgi:phosphoribosylamine--glycine ligase